MMLMAMSFRGLGGYRESDGGVDTLEVVRADPFVY